MRTLLLFSLCFLLQSALADEALKKHGPQSVGGLSDAKDSGAVTGIVKFTGPKPQIKKVTDIAGNGFCKTCYKPDELPNDPEFTISKDDTLANVLVYISKGLEGKKFPVPSTPVLLDQVGCMYTPHVVAVMAGQTLSVKNSDATMHNVMANPDDNAPFNFGMPAKDQIINKVFKEPEFRIKVRCFMHPWMVGYVHVLDTPFFAVTAADGKFTIKGLPPGEYELTVMHESSALKATPETAKIKIAPGQITTTDFTYELKSHK